MVKKQISKMCKSAIKLLTILRSKSRRKSRYSRQTIGISGYHQSSRHCQESVFRKLSQSRYAKYIPSQFYEEENARLNCLQSENMNSLFESSDPFRGMKSQAKQKLITKSLARMIETEYKYDSSFRNNLKELEQILNQMSRSKLSIDSDLLAMFHVMTEITNESKYLYKGKTCSTKGKVLFPQCFHYFHKNVGEHNHIPDGGIQFQGVVMASHKNKKVNIPAVNAQTGTHTKQQHSCKVQQCLLNTTPKKNCRKRLTYPQTDKQESDSKADKFTLNTRQESVTGLLNYTYREHTGKPHIEPTRLSLANEKHCQVVAELVDDVLHGKNPTTKHLVCVYADLIHGSNSGLSKLKHDMLSVCLNAYFFPRKDSVLVSWTPNTQELMSKATDEVYVKDIFGRRHQLSTCSFAAVMIVSQQAAAMLRHKQLCVLDSVSEVLGLARTFLLTVHADVFPQLFV